MMSDPIQKEVLVLLDEVLNLGGRALAFAADTPLLGEVPELDSMAVIAVIQEIEERFGIEVPDDEVDGNSFATVGTVVDFVTRLNARRSA
jgi:acyl carrier protein